MLQNNGQITEVNSTTLSIPKPCSIFVCHANLFPMVRLMWGVGPAILSTQPEGHRCTWFASVPPTITLSVQKRLFSPLQTEAPRCNRMSLNQKIQMQNNHQSCHHSVKLREETWTGRPHKKLKTLLSLWSSTPGGNMIETNA